MPELPEVQTIVNTLSPRITGLRISAVELRRTDILKPADTDLPGLLMSHSVRRIWRRAKRIMVQLDDGNCLYFHLGMTGRLTIEPPEQALLPHTHFIMAIGDLQVRFRDVRRFGGIRWLGGNGVDDGELGPEPLELRGRELHDRLNKTHRPIKSALLDQSLIAGLGNIYADEALFAAGIDPRRRADALSAKEAQNLTRAIKLVLRRAIKHRGSSLRDYVDADGKQGNFQRLHQVYGRTGLPCRKCGTPITRVVLGGRSTHFCRRCQHGSRS